MELIAYLIIFFSFIILFVYRKTKEFNSIKGAVLFLLFLTLLYLRSILGVESSIFVPETLFESSLFVGLFTLVLMIFAFKLKQRIVSHKYFVVLFILYIPMALIQQLFFQHIFLDTLQYLLKNTILSVILSSLFFKFFHRKKYFGRLANLTFFGNLVYATTYMLYGNILPLAISHAIIGTLYYSWIHEQDALSTRLKHKIKWLKIKK